LWFLDRLVPDSSFYHLSSAIRLTGELNVSALERAAAELVERHEVLRCRIEMVEEVATQHIGPGMSLEFADTDREWTEERAQKFIADWTERPFDLGQGPLIRMSLIRLAAQEHVLGVTLHHIVGDAWSFGILFTELSALYEAFTTENPSPLPALPMQYGDFAVWQRDRLSGERLETELEFWRQKLAGAPTSVELPLDRPRPKVASYKGGSTSLSVDASLTAALKRLARNERSTLFMVLLAAFEVLMVRWSGQQDLLVGVPVAGRSRREVEGLIGFFVNTLAMRLDGTGDPDFSDIVRRVRKTALESFVHQDLPFEILVEELSPERDLGRNPLVQVMFQLDNTPGEPAGLAGLEAEWFGQGEDTTTHFDLSMALLELDGELHGEISYATDLFDEDTIERLAEAYLRVLRQVTEDPRRRLSELSLVKPDQVSAPNASGACDLTITELFQRQADRTPEAVAVVCEGRSLTYSELRSSANRLARRLRRQGVGPEVTVGLCVERSLELVVAILGIVVAGGAYVPIDPDLPASAARLVIEDAAAAVVVTTSDLAVRFDNVVCVDGDLVDDESDEDLDRIVHQDNLIYVIYTSGSTGRPKGVMVRHGHVADYVLWCLDHLPLGEGGSVPLTSSISFAGVTLALFGSLISGRRLVVPDRHDLFSWCTGSDHYSFVKLTPSALQYARHRFGRCWDRWECVILASEPVRPRDWELVDSVEGLAPVIHYGATETNGSTVWWPSEGDPSVRQLPVGRPISSTQVLVLDPWGDPAPPGVRGEVFVGGPSVARGYLGRPALTAERFVPNHFGPPGSRLFRTGDLARWASDGNLEFLGRTDHQVKIRGYRVELGGVEREILALDAVTDAAVTVDHDPNGDSVLVAYAAVSPDRDLSSAELRSELERRLPIYMVPSRLTVVTDLPRTSSGKIDRSALAEIPATVPTGGEPPQTTTERAVAGIWAEVLHVEGHNRDDNFFALGGHSLLAIQVLARVRDTFGVDLALQVVFEAPTIAGQARRIEQARRQATESLLDQLATLSDEEISRMLEQLDG
jgi:amino acid adenylation domain-containing protein